MPSTNTLWREQARIIENSVEAWKRDHDEAMEIFDIEDLLNFVLEAIRFLDRVVKESFEKLFDGRVAEVLKLGASRLRACESMLKPMDDFREMIADVQANGYDVARADELEPAIDTLLSAQARLIKHWPRLDEEELRRGFAEADRGELIDAEEAFRELESHSHS